MLPLARRGYGQIMGVIKKKGPYLFIKYKFLGRFSKIIFVLGPISALNITAEIGPLDHKSKKSNFPLVPGLPENFMFRGGNTQVSFPGTQVTAFRRFGPEIISGWTR